MLQYSDTLIMGFNFDKDLLLFSVFCYGLFVLLIRRAKIKFEQKNLNVILRKKKVYWEAQFLILRWKKVKPNKHLPIVHAIDFDYVYIFIID